MRLIKGKTYYTKDWYPSYKGMMDRCYNKNVSNYPLYGGRGITVCDEWKNIEEFEIWLKGTDYRKGLTLERIDVNGNYSPQNCRWATKKEQANNRRNTKYLTYNGTTHTISEWADITGINRSTLKNRVYRGWDVNKIFREVNNGSFN